MMNTTEKKYKVIKFDSDRISVCMYTQTLLPAPKYECKVIETNADGSINQISIPMFFKSDEQKIKDIYENAVARMMEMNGKEEEDKPFPSFFVSEITNETKEKYLKCQKKFTSRKKPKEPAPDFPERKRKAKKEDDLPPMSELEYSIYQRLDYDGDETLVSCPCCGHVHNEVEYIEESRISKKECFFLAKAEYGDLWPHFYPYHDSSNTLRCPDCNHKFDIKMSKCYRGAFPLKIDSVAIFYEEDKIIIYGNVSQYIINKQARKLAIQKIHPSVVFNTKSGQTYIVPTKKDNGKQFRACAHLINITYSRMFTPAEIEGLFSNLELRAEIYKAIMDAHSISNYTIPNELMDLSKSGDSYFLSTMALTNRFPMLSTSQIEQLGKVYHGNTSEIFHNVKVTTPKNKLISCLDFNGQKLTKSSKKLIQSDLNNAFQLKAFFKLGFKNQDLFPKFCTEAKIHWINHFSRGNIKVKGNSQISFLRRLIKANGERRTIELLCNPKNSRFSFSSSSSAFTSAIEWYTLVTETKKVIPDNVFKGNLKNIIYNLKAFKTISNTSYSEIYYSSHEISKFNTYINGVSFCVAKSSKEIVESSYALHLGPVTGSINAALSKTANVVLGYDHGKLVMFVVVDLLGPKPSIIQAKAYAKTAIQGQYAIALMKYIERLDAEIHYYSNCINPLDVRFDKPSYSPSSYRF